MIFIKNLRKNVILLIQKIVMVFVPISAINQIEKKPVLFFQGLR